MNEAYNGVHEAGKSLFAVVKGSEIITSGPYFLTAAEALAWGFHQYVFHKPLSIPNKFLADDLMPPMPQDLDWEPKIPLEQFLYSDLPPVLIEVILDQDYFYSSDPLEDPQIKFDPSGNNVNVDFRSMTPTLKAFYDPKEYKLHSSKLALYKIYHKEPYSALTPMPEGSKINDQFLKDYKYNRIFKSRFSKEPHFWRSYKALRLSAPQNAIAKLIKANIDWPEMILKFFNFISIGGDYDYGKAESLLFRNIIPYIVLIDDRTFGLSGMDSNLLACIVSRIENSYDFLSLMSVNTKFRKFFNSPYYQKLYMKNHLSRLSPGYFSNLLNIKNVIVMEDYYVHLANSKNEYKMCRMGLVLDYDSFERMSRDINEKERLDLLKTSNSYFSCIGFLLSTFWNSNGFLKATFYGKVGSVNREIQIPREAFTFSNFYNRRPANDFKGSVSKMEPNSTWAFSLPSGCMQNLEMTSLFLEKLKEYLLPDRLNNFEVTITLRGYDPDKFKFYLSTRVMINGRGEENSPPEIITSLGPFSRSSFPDHPFGKNGLHDLKNRMPNDSLRLDSATVALQPFQVMTITNTGENLTGYLNIVYPYSNYFLRYMVLNENIVRLDMDVHLGNAQINLQ